MEGFLEYKEVLELVKDISKQFEVYENDARITLLKKGEFIALIDTRDSVMHVAKGLGLIEHSGAFSIFSSLSYKDKAFWRLVETTGCDDGTDATFTIETDDGDRECDGCGHCDECEVRAREAREAVISDLWQEAKYKAGRNDDLRNWRD